jgi:hypothetical protein
MTPVAEEDTAATDVDDVFASRLRETLAYVKVRVRYERELEAASHYRVGDSACFVIRRVRYSLPLLPLWLSLQATNFLPRSSRDWQRNSRSDTSS